MNHRPYLLLAELTYQCPLHCPYCSNPVAYPAGTELSTGDWSRAFCEASQMAAYHSALPPGSPSPARPPRLDPANTQSYGWGYVNRLHLLPTRRQVEAAMEIALAEKKRLADRMEIFYVLPDYFEDRPKPCMNGWGRRYLTVNPIGQEPPCPTASSIPGWRFENGREKPLAWVWNQEGRFNRFP